MEAGLADSARSLAAEAWIEAGDLDRAAAHLRMLSEKSGGLQPQDLCLLRLGDVLMRQGKKDEAVATFVQEAFRHHKTIGIADPDTLATLGIAADGPGVATTPAAFFEALARHRHWDR